MFGDMSINNFQSFFNFKNPNKTKFNKDILKEPYKVNYLYITSIIYLHYNTMFSQELYLPYFIFFFYQICLKYSVKMFGERNRLM